MAINAIARSIFEQMSDIVSIKSGLILPQNKAVSILCRDHGHGWWEDDLDSLIRIHYSEVESTFLKLMMSIGALKNEKSPSECLANFIKKNSRRTLNKSKGLQKQISLANELLKSLNTFLIMGEIIPKKFTNLPEFDIFFNEYLNRSMFNENPPKESNWGNCIPLNSLFESEEVIGVDKEESYFDQRYIDYLASQISDLQDIHWRQFEYLTGEYFKRSGYSVEVTQGRKDGGVDVIVKKENTFSGPELIYVQCKKFSRGNHVEIDSVRAFWSTINDNLASKGIIATTSKLTKGAREYCKARMYRLWACEEEKVAHWLNEMKKNINSA